MLKRGVRHCSNLQTLRLRKKQNELANSVDPVRWLILAISSGSTLFAKTHFQICSVERARGPFPNEHPFIMISPKFALILDCCSIPVIKE